MARHQTHREWIMESLLADVGTVDPETDRATLFTDTGDPLPDEAHGFRRLWADTETDAAW